MWDLIVSVPDHCLSFYFSCDVAQCIISLSEQAKITPIYLKFLEGSLECWMFLDSFIKCSCHCLKVSDIGGVQFQEWTLLHKDVSYAFLGIPVSKYKTKLSQLRLLDIACTKTPPQISHIP